MRVEVRDKGTSGLLKAGNYITDSSGAFEADLAALIGGSVAFDRAASYAVITAGDGISFARVSAPVHDLTADEVSVTIELVEIATAGSGALSGRVVDRSGRGVPNVVVLIRAGGNLGVGDFANIADSLTSRRVVTDAEGNFVAGGLLVGSYSLQARSLTTDQAIVNLLRVNASSVSNVVVAVDARVCPAGQVLQPGGLCGTSPGSPTVGEVTSNAVAGVATTFIVTGTNLPDGLSFQLDRCLNITPVLVGSTNSQRQFTCTFPIDTAEGTYDGTVATSSSPFGGPPLRSFTVTVVRPRVNDIAPKTMMRTMAASYEIVGTNLPTSGLSVVPIVPASDTRSNCQAPNNPTANGFGVACELFTLGPQTLEVRHGTNALGRVTVNVTSNVSRVTWTSPSTTGSGTVKFGETVIFEVHGTNLTADRAMGFAVEKCGVSNTELGAPTATLRRFTCMFNNEAGAVAGVMPGVVKDSYPNGQVLLQGWGVPVEVPAAVRRNLFLGAPVATSTLCGQACLGANTTDGNLATLANLGQPRGNFVVALDSPVSLSSVRLVSAMLGVVDLELRTHTDPAASTGGAGWTSHYRATTTVASGVGVEFPLGSGGANGVRQVEVLVHSAASYAAFFEIEGYGESTTSSGQLFLDTFSSLDTSSWSLISVSPRFPTPSFTSDGSILTVANGASLTTKGKVEVSGDTIVIESRMSSPSNARDVKVQLVDSANEAELIGFGETSYFGWGLHAFGYGRYNFVETERPSGVGPAPQNVTISRVSTPSMMEYRVTISGASITIERGPTLANITERFTRTLGQSIAGRKFYLQVYPGVDYGPGAYDWLRVTAPSVDRLPASTGVRPLPSTGTSASGALLGTGAADGNWMIVSGPGITTPIPAVASFSPGYRSSANARWIWVTSTAVAAFNAPYTFRLTFDLTGVDVSRLELSGNWSVDNLGAIRLNGLPAQGSGVLSLNVITSTTYTQPHAFRVGNLRSGVNTLDFVVTDTGGYGGLLVSDLQVAGSGP